MERKVVAGKIAAILSYLLLVDAAVETLLSRSPLWWILVPLLAAYLVISAILWRRTGRAPALIVSLAVLLGLLALTAWLPGGATRGIVLLGQPTSTVLIVITAVAVLVAGIRLVREPSIPRTLRWIIGALVVYSIVAFLFGVFAGVAYPDMFHAARWRLAVGDRGFSLGLPGWLQGAFIGAFLLLPAALIVQGLRSFFAKRPAPGGPRQLRLTQAGVEAIALSLSLFMALGTLRAPTAGRISLTTVLPSRQITQGLEASVKDLTSAVQAANPSTLPPGEQVAAQLEKAFPELEARANAIPRDDFDMQAVVDKVGRDPIVLFNWVRDQTRLLPYRGVLKGPVGVLMDRGGNSLDRALLLSALLRASGEQTQLVRATLPEEQARRVVERATQAIPQLPATQAIQIPDEVIESLARSSGIRPADVRQHLERVTAEQRRVGELTRTRTREQAQAIANAVGRPRTQDAQGETAAFLETLRDHWWLRWMKEGAWVDLDPTLPDAAPGSMLAAAQEPYEVERLPEDLFHVVTIRVVIERWADGRLAEQPVLSHRFRAADLHASQLILTHRPANFPSMGFLREKDALERFKSAVVGIRGWVPVLTVGDQEISQSGFTDKGEVRDKGALIEGPGAQAGERVRDILTGPRGSPPASTPQDRQGHLTAQWVEYEVRVPGQPPTAIRRQLFDLIGPAARGQGNPSLTLTDAQRLDRGLGLFGATYILPQAGWIPPSFVTYLVTRHLIQHRDTLIGELRRLPANPDPEDLSRRTGKLRALAIPVYGLALARQSWSEAWPALYLSRPNVLTSYSGRLKVAADGTLSMLEGFDIVANDVSVRPGSGVDPFVMRLQQGVGDTVAEAVLLAPAGVVENVSEIFAVSKAQGIDWISVRSARDATAQALRLPADVRARISQDLAAGYAIVAPRVPVRLTDRPVSGWWRVDPRTGHTLGIGERGAGQTATELQIMFGAFTIATVVCLAVADLEPCEHTSLGTGLTAKEAMTCLAVGLAAGIYANFVLWMLLGGAPAMVGGATMSPGVYATLMQASNMISWLSAGAGVVGGSAGTLGNPKCTILGPVSPDTGCAGKKLGPLRVELCPGG